MYRHARAEVAGFRTLRGRQEQGNLVVHHLASGNRLTGIGVSEGNTVRENGE